MIAAAAGKKKAVLARWRLMVAKEVSFVQRCSRRSCFVARFVAVGA